MKVKYRGHIVYISRDSQKRLGCYNYPISYAIFKEDEEIKSDSTYDFESIKDFKISLKKWIDEGLNGLFCSTPYLILK